ncbi:MAG: flagellar biosynthesis protein FlhB [Peptostreptococcales bacterium]
MEKLFIFMVLFTIEEFIIKAKEVRKPFRILSPGSIALKAYAFAESGGSEKTEAPTPKKIQDARKKGQIAKSPDLNAAIILLVSLLLMMSASDQSMKDMAKFLYINFTEYVNYNLVASNLRSLFLFYIFYFFRLTALMFIIVMIIGIATNLAQSKFIFSTEPLKPNFGKLNPIEGFKNIFSKKAAFNLVKTVLKLVLISAVAISFVKDNLVKIISTTGVQPIIVFTYVKEIVFRLLVQVISILLFLGIADFVFQKYDFKKNLRMTKQEIKEEWKQSEGDPHIKSKRKQKQREMSLNRMISEVSSASVVITNPTHLAVAIKYDEKVDEIPKVVAKGAGFIAEKIKNSARDNRIPVMENKPLARIMYKELEIGQEIPTELYKAVAEILAMVMNIKKKENYRR